MSSLKTSAASRPEETLRRLTRRWSQKNKFVITQDVLREPVRRLLGRYDYIFLDTAPNATTPTIAAYKAADWFILSAMPDPLPSPASMMP